MISEKNEAASMTPAAKPSIRFCCCSVGRPIFRIGSAPSIVASPAKRLATKPVRIMEEPNSCLFLSKAAPRVGRRLSQPGPHRSRWVVGAFPSRTGPDSRWSGFDRHGGGHPGRVLHVLQIGRAHV